VTAPRQILAGATYLVTRRCSERRFFLRPSEELNALFLYVLAVAAARYGVQVHALCVMSNHYHLLVTDPEAALPAFVQYLDALVARSVNASLGRWEGFWASGASYSAVRPGETNDIVRKAAYILANPVSAGLVRHGAEWPGLWTGPEDLGRRTFVAQRPKGFFREDGPMPATAELTLTVPPGFHSADAFTARVAAELDQLLATNPPPPHLGGRAAVLRQDRFARPAQWEPARAPNPRVACIDKMKRLEVLSRLASFLDSYRGALVKRRAGDMAALFPAGTYLMRALHGVRCAAAG
jgi:REP element-mobilizing transposase RayT